MVKRSRGAYRSDKKPGMLYNPRTGKYEYPKGYKGEKEEVIKRGIKPIAGKIQKAIVGRNKITAIKGKAPAIISQQLIKAKRIPYIIGGVLIAVYVLFKKGRKGGKK